MRGNRIDANQREIVAALRKVGCIWIDCSGDPAIGFDGLVIRKGQIWIVEIKDGLKPPSARELTRREKLRHEELAVQGVKIHVVQSVEDALALPQYLCRS